MQVIREGCNMPAKVGIFTAMLNKTLQC